VFDNLNLSDSLSRIISLEWIFKNRKEEHKNRK